MGVKGVIATRSVFSLDFALFVSLTKALKKVRGLANLKLIDAGFVWTGLISKFEY